MTKQEAFLNNEDLGDSLDTAEALIKKHEDFVKSLAAQEEKTKALEEFANKLVANNHYAAPEVGERKNQVTQRPALDILPSWSVVEWRNTKGNVT